MIEMTANLWEIYDRFTWSICCVTINGFVKKDGEAVMGQGTAKQAAERFPNLAVSLGRQLNSIGLHTWFIAERLIGFPTKPASVVVARDRSNILSWLQDRFQPGLTAPGWAAVASRTLIAQSLVELAEMYERCGWTNMPEWDPDPMNGKVFLPRPGCGAGGLDWEDVRPLCAGYGDWLVIIDKYREQKHNGRDTRTQNHDQ